MSTEVTVTERGRRCGVKVYGSKVDMKAIGVAEPDGIL